VEAGLHQRVELETPVPAQILDYRAIAESGLGEALSDPARRVRLQPVFVSDITRITRRLQPAPGTDIELCVDAGHIIAGERSVPISEIELELKAGPPEALLDFAAQLLAHLPMRLEPLSRAERGYALVQGSPAAPVKATAPQLDPQMSVTQAFRAIVANCVSHLQANESGVLAGAEEEYLHQARVALRRLRSAMSVFQPAFPRAAVEGLIAQLRWLTACLGPARDWDVFALDTLPALRAAFPDDAGLGPLTERAARLRAQAGERAREALASRRYTALLLELTALFLREPWQRLDDASAAKLRASGLGDFAQQVLQRRHRKAIKRGKRHAELDAAGLHRLRIDIKKLRYAAEFFSTLYERKAVRAYAASLSRLQELLGSLNDAATVERLCASLHQPSDSGPCLEALGMVRGWGAATARAHMQPLPRAWDEFREVEAFW
jgi:inorganic triphosphatase YgiF